MEYHFLILIFALLLDRYFGDPDWLWQRVPHPVVLYGRVIGRLDDMVNRDRDHSELRRRNGVLVLAFLLVLSVLIGVLLSAIFDRLGWAGMFAEIPVVAVFLAQKSLTEHVLAVASVLKADGLDGGRRAVARIVGRDPDSLDEAGVCRAAIESLSENFADGVVAPAFWYALLGLPGLLAYKMLNTADSMIGHRSERYQDFGWAAARLDDAANWPASRLSALLIATGAFFVSGAVAAKRAFNAAFRDAGLHRSPNAGWPECAMAGALRLSLAGERIYGGVVVREPRLNASGRHAATVTDIEKAVAVFGSSCTVLIGALFVAAMVS